jgi:hypothetical protein
MKQLVALVKIIAIANRDAAAANIVNSVVNLAITNPVITNPVKVNAEGAFLLGMTTIQCMYAPEFGSHTKGDKIYIVK